MNHQNQYFDDARAEKLHDRRFYALLKRLPEEVHPTTVQALLESLDDHDLALISSCTNWEIVAWKADRILKTREERRKTKNATHRLNYLFQDVLDDYIQKRRGKRREARRQLRARFDGLDHDQQEAVMMAFMRQGTYSDRELIYDKLYGDDFWIDDYIPLVEKWWEEFQDGKMAKVVVKRCSREYVLAHLEELKDRCNYASLCLKTGMTPEAEKLPYRTYLYVLKCIGGQLHFREGEETILKWVRQYLYEDEKKTLFDSIFDIPYVKRMMLYLGEMGLTDDILALEAFDKRMQDLPRLEWGTDIIQAIEEEFRLPEYIFKEVK